MYGTTKPTITIDFGNRLGFISRLENLLKFQKAACEAEAKKREQEYAERKAAYRWYRPSTWWQPDEGDRHMARWYYEEPVRETQKHLTALRTSGWVAYTIPVTDYNSLIAAMQRAENP